MPSIFVWRIRLALAALAFALAQGNNLERKDDQLSSPHATEVPSVAAAPSPDDAVQDATRPTEPAQAEPSMPAVPATATTPAVHSVHAPAAVRKPRHDPAVQRVAKRQAHAKAQRRAQLVSARPPAEEWPFPTGKFRVPVNAAALRHNPAHDS